MEYRILGAIVKNQPYGSNVQIVVSSYCEGRGYGGDSES